MTKEQLLKHYEDKLRYGSLVYGKIKRPKRILHNLLLVMPIMILAWPSLQIAITPDWFGNGWEKFFQYMAYVTAAIAVMLLANRTIAKHSVKQLRKTNNLKQFYVKGEVNYNGFKIWQQDQMFEELKRHGLEGPMELDLLHKHLETWMRRERFALIGFVTIMAAISLPIWSAYLTVLFDKDIETTLGRLLALIGLLVFTGILVGLLRTLNELYNTVLSKYNRISELRDVVERIILFSNKYQSSRNK